MTIHRDVAGQRQAAQAHPAHEGAEQHSEREARRADDELEHLEPHDLVDERGAAAAHEEEQEEGARARPARSGAAGGDLSVDHDAPLGRIRPCLASRRVAGRPSGAPVAVNTPERPGYSADRTRGAGDVRSAPPPRWAHFRARAARRRYTRPGGDSDRDDDREEESADARARRRAAGRARGLPSGRARRAARGTLDADGGRLAHGAHGHGHADAPGPRDRRSGRRAVHAGHGRRRSEPPRGSPVAARRDGGR